MDLDKLKEILGIEGTEQDEKIEAAIAAINEETAGLVSTKDKLRLQVKDLDKRLKAFKDVDLEAIDGMKTELEELREAAAGKGGGVTPEERKELALLQRENKKLNEQVENERKGREIATKQVHDSLKERELRKALKGINVLSEDEDLIYDAFVNKAKIEEIDGSPVVQFTNKDGLDLPPNEFFADWAKSDSAKRHIRPPDNSGGGARGGSGTGSAKIMKLAEFNQLSPDEQMEFMTEKHGQVTE